MDLNVELNFNLDFFNVVIDNTRRSVQYRYRSF